MTLFDALTRPLRRFRSDSRGSASVELVIVLPLLLWGLAATVVFFDGYKARYHAEMAAQTVADIMSRETDLFTGEYIEGLNDVFDFLADSEFPTRIRVSSVIWDSENERHRLQWSYGSRDFAPLPADTFELMQEGDLETLLAQFGEDTSFSFAGAAAQMPIENLPTRIPPVLPGEALLLVETFALWSPFASVGVGQLRFTPVVVVRPRFAPWINFEGVEPVYPETDYEIAWTGGGNTDLPDPNDPDPVDPDPPANPTAYSFDDGVTTNWSQTPVASGGPTGSYLGPFGNATYASPVNLSVNLASSGMNATIAFDLLIIDSWDGYDTSYALPRGDTVTLMINGSPISMDPFVGYSTLIYNNTRVASGYLGTMTYTLRMEQTRVGSSFVGSTSYEDQIWRATLTVQNAPQSFTLGFSSGSDSSASDESFGIDNLSITASGTGTAAPFTPNAANLLTADPHTRFPRYSGCPDFRIQAPWLSILGTDLGTGISMIRSAGGQTNLANCSSIGGLGSINASPHLVVNYTNDRARTTLQFSMDDGNSGYTCDTTLLVRDTAGQWWFNDDTNGYNPAIRISNAPTGQYFVYVGTYGSTQCDSRLRINRP